MSTRKESPMCEKVANVFLPLGTELTVHYYDDGGVVEIVDAYFTEVVETDKGKKALRRVGYDGEITDSILEQLGGA